MTATSDLLEALLGGNGEQTDTPAERSVAVAWARVSTDMQEERGLSIPEQLREIRAYAEEHSIEVAQEFSETASAFQKEEKRVEFHRMLAAAKSNPDVSVILVHDLSRFSRDSVRAKTLTRELRRANIRVISLNDPEIDPESVAGVYMEAITFAKNEAYSREVAFHTIKGCRANVRTRDAETGWCYKNGGRPIWGFRSEQLLRGERRKGRPIVKSIWVPDEEVVAGRPLHQWTRHCLVEMAAKGASLNDLRDFCNRSGLPARRGGYWSVSTWHSLLEPYSLLTYAGYGVWNVRAKGGRKRPPSEWEIVPNAHPAIISEEEAKAIADARAHQRRRGFDRRGKSRKSRYLLSGGLFRCGRCGANMAGFKSNGNTYYVCGSHPYRHGLGCGPGVYVRQEQVETEVVDGVQDFLAMCADTDGFAREVNAELRKLWDEQTGQQRGAARELREVEGKIANVRKSIEDGLRDTAWANSRLQELLARRGELADTAVAVGEAPQVQTGTAVGYLKDLRRVFAPGRVEGVAEQKDQLRAWVDSVVLSPEELTVTVTYRVPEPVMVMLVPGPRFELGTPGFSVQCSTN